ncbi:MAG: potassium-transporting ATPase subunit C [Magnetospirillum sp.]|nr:potassium-transporting ATPase subunit C [Magnetospirillum sp.]
MKREAKWPALVPLIAVLAFIVFAVVLADRQGPQPPAVDLRYFHPRPGASGQFADLGYASIQVKSVAASRHVPVQEVRRLMGEYTIGRDGPMIGRQRVDIPKLNEALDERWPMK